MPLVDLSHQLNENTPPFPGDLPVEISVQDSTEQNDRAPREHLNCSRVATSVHCGTHMDAPFHFFGGGRTIESVPLEICVGSARVIDLGLLEPLAEISAARLRPFAAELSGERRVLLNTGWSRRWGTAGYFTEHPVITADGARMLVESGCRLVGVDFPSVDRPPFPAHLELLGSDVVILENLTNLEALTTPTFRLIATPLALTGRDGSPLRVVAEIDAG